MVLTTKRLCFRWPLRYLLDGTLTQVMEETIEIGDAKVAVRMLKGKVNVFDSATEVEVYPNGWVKLVNEDGETEYFPQNHVGSIKER